MFFPKNIHLVQHDFKKLGSIYVLFSADNTDVERPSSVPNIKT